MYQNRKLKSFSLRVSVIIPTLNESEYIVDIIEWLNLPDERLEEIIVVDGGSEDNTVSLAEKFGARAIPSHPSRSLQMNAGSLASKGNVLYFVHADTKPPKSYLDDIEESIYEGFLYGCYRSEFETASHRMKFNAFFTRYRCLMFRGGDQSLFVDKSFFEQTGGFDESQFIMEDYAWLLTAKKQSKLRIIQKGCLISTRKYDKNSYFRINLANLYVFILFYLGFPSHKIAKVYKKLIK